MSENSRTCRCCTVSFVASNSHLEFCSRGCVETYFTVQQEELLQQKKVQIVALGSQENCCLICGKSIEALTKRGTPKSYCGPVCSSKAIPRRELVTRSCVHCDASVDVLPSVRPNLVRCPKHKNLWPKVRSESARNMKRTKVAEAPYDQYLLKGPWWDHPKKHWRVLLMHSGASSKREVEYARYLLSVKEGKRLSDSIPVVYVDGDRTNVDINNLAMG